MHRSVKITILALFMICHSVAFAQQAVDHEEAVKASQAWRMLKGPAPSPEVFQSLEAWLQEHPEDPETAFHVAVAMKRKKLPDRNGSSDALLMKSALAGFAPAQTVLAAQKLISNVPKEREEGLRLLTAAIQQNDPEAKWRFGRLFAEPLGQRPANPDKARKLLQEAANDGVPYAWVDLALVEAKLGHRPEAFAAAQKGADLGEHTAQYTLGMWYATGFGFSTAQDKSTALAWLTEATKDEFQYAKYAVAVGDFCSSNPDMAGGNEAAIKWYKSAASTGDSVGRYRVAQAELKGYGTEMNTGKAISELTVLADAGMADAQFAMGLLYLDGILVERDIDHAQSLFSIASKQGNDKALLYEKWLSNYKK